MQKTLLTFGDSNTHGTMPMTAASDNFRYGVGQRWPSETAQALGSSWRLIEEGLPGRTATAACDPIMGAHMNGQTGLQIALGSHKPIDLLTIMLGTNDCKPYFGLTAQGIASAIAGLIAIAKDPDVQARHGGFEILLIAPPVVQERGAFVAELWQAAGKSAALPALYADLAAHTGIAFLDASPHVTTCAEDGVHFDEIAHQTLGQLVAAKIASL